MKTTKTGKKRRAQILKEALTQPPGKRQFFKRGVKIGLRRK